MHKHAENEFVALRARAKAKRDKGIAALRDEYEQALVAIADLEQTLLGTRPVGYKKISAAIEAVIPRDAPFTTLDVMTGLEAIDPRRVWRKRSVDWTLTGLRKKGIIRRIKRATIHEPATYVRAESPIRTPALADTTLMQVIGKVLTRPMTTTEVCVAAVEAGHQTAMGRNNLRNHVTRLLGKGGWKQDGGKWLP